MLKHITLLTDSAGQRWSSFPPYRRCIAKRILRYARLQGLYFRTSCCVTSHVSPISCCLLFLGIAPIFRCLVVKNAGEEKYQYDASDC